MSTPQIPKATQLRRTRKSIGHLPSPDVGLDKENTELGNVSTAASKNTTTRKPRSKSLGPGGLDALKDDAGNRQKFMPTVRSILKPTIPLSPPKAIPPHPNPQKASHTKAKPSISPRKAVQKPAADDDGRDNTSLRQSGLENLPNPFDEPRKEPVAGQDALQETRVAVRTEEEQQAAVKERERQEMINRRDARRKSLANRRVSFAPEATLHTWNVVELAEDATTSSEATNSTRRASNGSTLTATPFLGSSNSDSIEAPSTPIEQIEEIQVAASPADQRKAHQKKRRRSSGIPPMNFNNPDDFSSSPDGSITSEDTETNTFVEGEVDAESSDSDDNDLIEAEDTITGVDQDDNTNHSMASVRSGEGSSTSSSDRLERSLRQAAILAGTQGIEYDEHGDLTMEMADDEVTNAFRPLAKQAGTGSLTRDPKEPQEQENFNPFALAFKANIEKGDQTDNNPHQDQTMDFTVAPGIIIGATQQPRLSPRRKSRKPVTGTKKRNSVGRRRSSGASSLLADETMELTTALGVIQHVQPIVGEVEEVPSADEDEELTMEFTSAVGDILDSSARNGTSVQSLVKDDTSANRHIPRGDRRASVSSVTSDGDMDMTVAMGGILSSITERTEPREDETREMDITTAIGAILPEDLRTTDKFVAKQLMEQETDHGQLTRSPFERKNSQEPVYTERMEVSVTTEHLAFATTETGSPSLVSSQARVARKSGASRLSSTPTRNSRQTTPLKKPTTPSKQPTPQPSRPATPGKTPPAKNVGMRMTSPRRLFKADIKKAAVNTQNTSLPALSFSRDVTTGLTTPSIVLKPHARRSSGIGADTEGLGSPRVAALLDRRASIGESAQTFTPQGKFGTGVRFEDPRVIQQELENERSDEERRESGRGILQLEADPQDYVEEKDVTANLRDMIESLTPKKKKLKGRKSLHVGAAKGLLGKRPLELDEEDEEEQSPKRMIGQDRSPVKSIKLPAPPSKMQTTGRGSKAPLFSLGVTSGNGTLQTPTMDGLDTEGDNAITPKIQNRYKDTELVLSAAKPPISFNDKIAGMAEVASTQSDGEEDRIHLQDFLNMTSIRFMELTTTKRRHTMAPNPGLEDSIKRMSSQGNVNGQRNNGRELESCVVAGACTVPMLELYQHSCRELKKYISEGRSIVHEIEADTLEDNPPLFREYLSAAPEVRSIMDNQFKNVKTHARLLSKAMWYEWRMKLLDGLKDGLLRISKDMASDAENLAQQENLLEAVVPALIEEHEQLQADAELLQAQADELASCDQEELTEARERLIALDGDLEAKRKMIADLHQCLKTQEENIEQVTERKEECLGEIKEAERVREECRGWSVAEVAALKDNIDALEKSHGWIIASASGSSLTLTYRSTLQLFLTPSSFRVNNASILSPNASIENSPISLTYIADTHTYHPKPLSTEHRFFLQMMRARLQCVVQAQTHLKEVLSFVSITWEQADKVSEQIKALNSSYITTPEIKSDDALAVKASVLLREMQTKVECTFELLVRDTAVENGEGIGFSTTTTPVARVVYGEQLKEGKMREFLALKVGKEALGWAATVRELEVRLLARGKRENGKGQ